MRRIASAAGVRRWRPLAPLRERASPVAAVPRAGAWAGADLELKPWERLAVSGPTRKEKALQKQGFK